MKVVFTARARADVMAQLTWLSERTPMAARKAVERLHTRLALLADFPASAPAIDHVQREATIRFGRDGFVVRYRLEADVIVVIRLFHGKQKRR